MPVTSTEPSELMSDTQNAPREEATFEEQFQQLEQIVESLENDAPPLEEALDAYEEGVTLARACLERLRAAELRVEELSIE